MTRAALVISFVVSVAPLGAQGEPRLSLPLDCTLGEDCFIQQYVDRDPGPGAADFMGGGLTYDGHRGTDIRVIGLDDMAAGVDVLAAAPGVVKAARDGMPDRTVSERGEVAGRECGNGVLVEHGDGWETQYCHLRQGSIRVRPGDAVTEGSMLGQIGLSGLTEFPHVHIAVRKDGVVVDPFAPECEGCSGASLWADPPDYRDAAFMEIGFADRVPAYQDVRAGAAGLRSIARELPALVVYIFALGKVPGDRLVLTLLGPDGQVLADDESVFERSQAQYFQAVGLRRPDGGWPTGTYTGEATLIRDEAVIDRKVIRMEID